MKYALAVACVAALASAQPVVHARAGLLLYFDGTPLLETLRIKHGPYTQVLDGETLRTRDGLVEMQISGGAVIRLARGSEFKMLNGQMDDAEVTLLNGSAIIEVTRMIEGSRFRMHAGDCTIEPRKPGVYRLEASPPRLRVYSGYADAGCLGKQSAAGRGRQMDLSGVMKLEGFDRKKNADPFLIWSAQRSFFLYRGSAENRRKQNQWQRTGRGKYWNEAYARGMP